MAGVKGSGGDGFFPLLFEKRGSVANHTHCWKTTVRRQGRGQEEKGGHLRKGWRRKKKYEGTSFSSASHLIVDIKHSLLDLLIDILGCVDESLRYRQEETEFYSTKHFSGVEMDTPSTAC